MNFVCQKLFFFCKFVTKLCCVTTINITGLNLTNRKWYGNEDIETNENFQLKNERNTLIIYPEVTPKKNASNAFSQSHKVCWIVRDFFIPMDEWPNFGNFCISSVPVIKFMGMRNAHWSIACMFFALLQQQSISNYMRKWIGPQCTGTDAHTQWNRSN